jgi:dolichol-phosphate mannosyltransferase
MRTLVVLPSYNESGNITRLMDEIISLNDHIHICVVDDNSPDGTPELVRSFISERDEKERSRIHLIVREKKSGRGGAVRHGFQWGLEEREDFDSFVEMDCDFSHPPGDIPTGIERLRNHDIVIGARYPDGKIVGWPLSRKVLSYCANLLARALISWRVPDYTNGFRFYSREVAAFMCSIPQRHVGYIYLSETIAAFLKAGYRLNSFPIVFTNRTVGVSNTSPREVMTSLGGIFGIAWNYRFGRSD